MQNTLLMFVFLTGLGIVVLDVEGLGTLLYLWMLRVLYQVVKTILVVMAVFFTVVDFFRRSKEDTNEGKNTQDA